MIRGNASADGGQILPDLTRAVRGRCGRSVGAGGRYPERLGWAPIRSGIEKRHGVAGPGLSVEGRPDTEPLSVQKGSPRMPANNARTESGGFSAEERAAMKARAAELRAGGTKGARKADGLQAVLDSIAQMAPQDRALAGRVHVTVTAAAPGSVAEDLVRDARLRERGRQGRRLLLPERGQVQLPLLDPGLTGRG